MKNIFLFIAIFLSWCTFGKAQTKQEIIKEIQTLRKESNELFFIDTSLNIVVSEYKHRSKRYLNNNKEEIRKMLRQKAIYDYNIVFEEVKYKKFDNLSEELKKNTDLIKLLGTGNFNKTAIAIDTTLFNKKLKIMLIQNDLSFVVGQHFTMAHHDGKIIEKKRVLSGNIMSNDSVFYFLGIGNNSEIIINELTSENNKVEKNKTIATSHNLQKLDFTNKKEFRFTTDKYYNVFIILNSKYEIVSFFNSKK